MGELKKKIKLKVQNYTDEQVMQLDFISALSDKFDFEISTNPDYIISFEAIPDYLEYDCVRIQCTGENIRPDFNITDYAIGFDFINFDDRYLRWPLLSNVIF